MVDLAITEMLNQAQEIGVYGLMFQHITLCPTRTWLHYHRVDCAHLNRHMQRGLWVHATSYGGTLNQVANFGIRPDQVNWSEGTVSEVKSSRSADEAARMQLLFYMAVLIQATQTHWIGLLRTPQTRRIERVEWNDIAEEKILRAFAGIKQIVQMPSPPNKTEKNVCRGCSYRLLCWGLSTEDKS